MKKISITILCSLVFTTANAQNFQFESMPGTSYIFYQHSLNQPLKSMPKVNLTHIASYIIRYNVNSQPGRELMNQAYVGYQLSNSVQVMAGVFSTNTLGFKGSLALKYFRPIKSGVFVLIPRIDVQRGASMDLFSLIEYSPEIAAKVNLYTRFQIMTNVGTNGHNRSYQQLRLGIVFRNLQFGAALNLDEYGSKPDIKSNVGPFLKVPM